MTQGTKLLQHRLTAKLTQKEVAERIHVDASTYGSWEADHTQVKAKYLQPLADVFGVPVVALLSDEPAPRVANDAQPLPLPNGASLAHDVETHYQERITALKESNRDKDALNALLQERIQRLEAELKKLGGGRPLTNKYLNI